MLRNLLRTGLLTVMIIVILAVAAAPAAAAISGFVARDGNGGYHFYSYDDLLDSYALKILGSSNGLYEDFTTMSMYAVLHSSGGYIDYASILDRYAAAILSGQRFDLSSYSAGTEAKKAQLPDIIKAVTISGGSISRSDKKITPEGDQTNNGTGNIKIAGQAEVTLDQALKWARDRGAAQIFIDVAPLYWHFGEQTGIRPEVLYAQAAVETNYGIFSGVVPSTYNNWSSIRTAEATGFRESDYEQFPTAEEGVRAHFNHISAYLGLEPLGQPHGRYNTVLQQPWAGTVTHLNELSGKWAPAQDYHTYVAALVGQMLELAKAEQNPSPGNGSSPPPQSDPGNNPDQGDNSNTGKNTVIVNVSVLNFRSGPGTEHSILSQVTRGTILQVTGTSGSWLNVIRPGGQKGWVHGDYVLPIDLSEKPLQGRVIVIDPGHGGQDPGARGVTGLLEKDVNLIVALKLVHLLNEAGANVVMTRSDDRTVANQKRVDVANSAGADLFISIHANAFSNPESNGTETYYCTKTEHSADSLHLAQQLQRELVKALGMRDRGVKTSSFYVITKAEIPSALVEMGFLTNEDNEAILRDPQMQEQAAVALFLGIQAYFTGTR